MIRRERLPLIERARERIATIAESAGAARGAGARGALAGRRGRKRIVTFR